MGSCRTIEVLVFDANFVECFANKAQVLNKLAENQCAVFAFAQFINDLHKQVKLGRRLGPFWID